ncbi:hypothetical protein FACS1894166_11590 [Bacilli bacterium]|nr:hypothetical protein FACS1894166_11590 [Bacilli bacterium]
MNAYNMDGKAPQITRILFDNILKCRAQVESKLEHINIFCDYANNEGIVKDIGSNFINNYHGELVTVVDELQQVKSIIDDKKEKAKSKEKSK